MNYDTFEDLFYRIHDLGAIIIRPATEDEIAECNSNLESIGTRHLPDEYAEFLTYANGTAWNGFDFFGTYRVTHRITLYTLADIVSFNENAHLGSSGRNNLIIVGRFNDDLFVYNSDIGKFQALDGLTLSELKNYDSFEDLFVEYLTASLAIEEEKAASNDILYLKPFFAHTVWGGTKIRECFGYEEPGDDIGECWGISAHPDGMTYVTGGEYDGRSLADLWENEKHLFCSSFDRFPLLVKIIDAKEDLSIQVHPDDEYAGLHENGSLGKSECWYILDCSEDAKLVIGHNAKTKEELEEMISSERWSELIREVPVKKGDFIEIVPGTMHAIKGGVMLLETQQNSDITYRVYDYGRLWNGHPRQLHTRQSIEVITVPADEPKIRQFNSGMENESFINDLDQVVTTGTGFEVMCQSPRYSVYKATVRNDSLDLPMLHPFMNATVIAGSGKLSGHPVKRGDNVILTAECKRLSFDGQMIVILSGVG